ncbi:MAG: hypothetical protein M1357_01975, partial [Candidatus Marsarchaeota archaeon]|nr:hypothetical protein [Candidatus Marsarchaeota archaeon]
MEAAKGAGLDFSFTKPFYSCVQTLQGNIGRRFSEPFKTSMNVVCDMDHKKILYLCNLNLSKGGAQRVTFKTLGCLSKVFDIVVYMPEKPSPESLVLLRDLGIEYVLDEELDLERLKGTVASKKIDLVLIQREHPLWITTVYRVKKAIGVEYVVFVHELPFIGTPPERSQKFRNWHLLIFLRYLRLFYSITLDRLHKGYEENFIAQPPGVVRETRVRRTISPKKVLRVIATIRYTKSGLKSAKRVIAVGPASKFYIDNYLGLHNTTVLKHTAAPDITLNNDLDHRNFVYDICFMAARLERGKGIFDVLEVVHRLKTTLNRDVRAVMLGRFLDNRTQKMFL